MVAVFNDNAAYRLVSVMRNLANIVYDTDGVSLSETERVLFDDCSTAQRAYTD